MQTILLDGVGRARIRVQPMPNTVIALFALTESIEILTLLASSHKLIRVTNRLSAKDLLY